MDSENGWWSGLPGERCWCEITDRAKVGDDLICPQADETGKPFWSYSLILQIRIGDIVFHYYTPAKAFIGASIALGTVRESEISWVPHGTIGRAKTAHAASRPAWRLPLGNYVPASHPLTLEEVQKDELWVRGWISDKKALAGTVAAPFQAYPGKLRGTQGYLTKMPLEFVNRWPKLRILFDQLLGPSYVEELATVVHDDGSILAAVFEDVRNRRQGFCLNPKVRRVIEQFAVERAKKYYESKGFKIEVKGKPYDLRCSKADTVLHVEVKGTTTLGGEVLLTPNEVTFANEHSSSMALFIVSGIQISAGETPVASGGDELEIRPWEIESQNLAPIGYTYMVPEQCKVAAVKTG